VSVEKSEVAIFNTIGQEMNKSRSTSSFAKQKHLVPNQYSAA